uniref:Phage protein n=1 Tax=Rhabditophanes sp. KR3021 TaxID=114890 RepID=A0AC35TVJ4_9BILA
MGIAYTTTNGVYAIIGQESENTEVEIYVPVLIECTPDQKMAYARFDDYDTYLVLLQNAKGLACKDHTIEIKGKDVFDVHDFLCLRYWKSAMLNRFFVVAMVMVGYVWSGIDFCGKFSVSTYMSENNKDEYSEVFIVGNGLEESVSNTQINEKDAFAVKNEEKKP